jgi:uncharacterized BrkB/YihY/UPF0761 family membrane protein
VALNRVWNCASNRSYFKNQLIGLALVFACGALMLVSVTLTALNDQFLRTVTRTPPATLANITGLVLLKLAALPMSMLLLFLIYWLLPNCKVPPVRIIPVAIVVGLFLEFLKYVNLWTWPYLRAKLALEYGPFVYTVTIILWGFVAALVVLAGAEWSARHAQGTTGPPESKSRSLGFLGIDSEGSA